MTMKVMIDYDLILITKNIIQIFFIILNYILKK
jgi:hypothetical protein